MGGVPPDVSIGASKGELGIISMASISMADQDAEGIEEAGDGILGRTPLVRWTIGFAGKSLL